MTVEKNVFPLKIQETFYFTYVNIKLYIGFRFYYNSLELLF